MASKLPAPEDFGVELPRGNRAITAITPDPAGGVMRDFGQRVEKMAAEEADRLDRINVQDALSELSDVDTELTYGDKGFARRDVDVVKDPTFRTGYQTQYQQKMEAIAAKINSPKARDGFMAAAQSRRAQFNQGLVGHLSRLVEKAQDVSNKVALTKLETRIDYEPASLTTVIAERVETLLTEKSKFPDGRTFADYVEAAKGALAAKAVRSALAKDKYELAEKYLDEYGSMMGGYASDARELLKTRKADTLATTLAAGMIDRHKRGEPETAIKDWASKEAEKTDPARALDITRRALADLALYQGMEKEKHNTTMNEQYLRFTDGSRILTPAAVIRKDNPAYDSLPAAERVKLDAMMDRMKDELAQEARAGASAARERVAEAEARKRDDVNNQALVSNLLYDPDRLAQMNLVEIEAMKSQIGGDYTRVLADAHIKLMKNAEAYKADKAAVDAVLAPITSTEKKKRMYLMVQPAVEAWKKLPENKGKTPDANTLHQIVANTAKRLTEEKTFGNDERYLWQYRDEGRLKNTTLSAAPIGGKAAVTMPGDFVAAMLRRYPHLSDPQLATMWSKQTPAETKRWGR